MMAVLWFYIQQLLSLTTKNGQLNATSDDVDRQAVITDIKNCCHVWPYNCVQCAGTASTPSFMRMAFAALLDGTGPLYNHS